MGDYVGGRSPPFLVFALFENGLHGLHGWLNAAMQTLKNICCLIKKKKKKTQMVLL